MILNKQDLEKEIVFQYGFTKKHTKKIIEEYTKKNQYNDLCELVKNHKNIT